MENDDLLAPNGAMTFFSLALYSYININFKLLHETMMLLRESIKVFSSTYLKLLIAENV